MSLLTRIINIDYKKHLIFALVLRFILIWYGNQHDEISEVKYTDIDYKVFTDASRHLLKGGSPYDRHTYRYSPLLAIFLVPNILLHPNFGKILFCIVDILVALLIRLIVRYSLREYSGYKQSNLKRIIGTENMESKKLNPKKHRKFRQTNKQHLTMTKAELGNKSEVEYMTDISMMAWLYNPLTIAISTRGNCDSLAVFLVLLTLYLIQCKQTPFLAGLVHGVSVHFRLYPFIYSITFYMFLSKFSFYTTEDRRTRKKLSKAVESSSRLKQLKNVENTLVQSSSLGGHKIANYKEKKTIFKREYILYLFPNVDQCKLMLGFGISLLCLTLIFYKLFGFKFLYETYIYHFTRKDPRHNFSLYFYLQYLTAWVKNIGIWQKALIMLPQLVLILVFSVRYGLNRFSLNFSVLVQTIVMVIYNSVLTSQYFVWIMAILPLCFWQIKISLKMATVLLIIWFVAQGVWLLPAYLLEFQGHNTFLFIWIQSVSFFCANIAILGRLIMYFMPLKEKPA